MHLRNAGTDHVRRAFLRVVFLSVLSAALPTFVLAQVQTGNMSLAATTGARQQVDLRFNGEYVFGLSKAVVRSSLVSFLKAPVLLVTVPVDVALLPPALFGGFLR